MVELLVAHGADVNADPEVRHVSVFFQPARLKATALLGYGT
jgi:hypothetical protein